MKIKTSTPVALILLLLTLTFALSANLAHAQESASTHFRGSIGESRFEMTLKREGDQLQGSYFYVKSGSSNQLSLRGKINADGTFTMQEFDSSGRQTGEFKGTWENDPNESGASLEGEWKKPGAKDDQGFSASEQMLFFTNGTQITDGHINESIKAKRLDLAAEYPELTGAANAAGFNQLVKSRVTKELADFRKQMMSLSAEDLKMLPAGVNNYIEISYNIEYADNNLISVSFLEGTFGGGVHPNYNYFTITYDLKNGREIKLSELFKPGANYLKAVSDYATRDLQGRKMPDSDENMGLAQDIFAEGATAKAENYRNWNLTKKGLMFTFDPYQVGPYAAGPQTVIVPYAELKAIARSGGPLELF
ncbi:MAG TPA: DUF3298 domain-containing protein [Pyrinomonadaceae bacterium]